MAGCPVEYRGLKVARRWPEELKKRQRREKACPPNWPSSLFLRPPNREAVGEVAVEVENGLVR